MLVLKLSGIQMINYIIQSFVYLKYIFFKEILH